MRSITLLKARLADESSARTAAERRERDALIRAQWAEYSERYLTCQLDRAHREIDHLKFVLSSPERALACR